MRRWGSTILAVFIAALPMMAQEVNPQLWVKVMGQIAQKQHTIGVELIARQQPNPAAEHPMPWETALMRGVRVWYSYQMGPRWKLETAPFAWMDNTVIQAQHTKILEYRTAAYMNWNSRSDVWKWMIRSGIETRFIGLTRTPVARWREKVGIRYAVSKKFQVAIFDEVMLPMYPKVLFEPEQHRIGFNVGYAPQKCPLTLDATAMAIKRPGPVPCDLVIGLGMFYHLKTAQKV